MKAIPVDWLGTRRGTALWLLVQEMTDRDVTRIISALIYATTLSRLERETTTPDDDTYLVWHHASQQARFVTLSKERWCTACELRSSFPEPLSHRILPSSTVPNSRLVRLAPVGRRDPRKAGQLFVRVLDGQSRTLDPQSDDTVCELILELATKEKMRVHGMRLVFGGRILPHNLPVTELPCHVTIHLVLALRGD